MGADHLVADRQGGQAEPEGVLFFHHLLGEEQNDRNQYDGKKFGIVTVGGEGDKLWYKDNRQAGKEGRQRLNSEPAHEQKHKERKEEIVEKDECELRHHGSAKESAKKFIKAVDMWST